jgi:hypothetical protein
MSDRDFTLEDFDREAQRKNWSAKRAKGSIPLLTDNILNDLEWLRDWLTAVLRPPEGWRVLEFVHGEHNDMPCTLTIANGTREVKYRWRSQRDLTSSGAKLRTAVASIAGGQLRPPHLKPEELGDLWQALCTLQPALAAEDELEQARDWLFRLLDVTHTLEGYTLRKGGAEQRDALLALRQRGEFSYLDAVQIRKNPEAPWPVRPTALIDSATGEIWLRARESATFLRAILDVRIRQSTLTYRWEEIGVEYQFFESRQRRPGDPHPKAHMYLVPKAKPESSE